MALESALKPGSKRLAGWAAARRAAVWLCALVWAAPAFAIQSCRTDVAIALNGARFGNLSPDDAPLSRFVADAGESRSDRYLVAVPRAGELKVNLQSDAFGPLLLIMDWGCREVARRQAPRTAVIQQRVSAGNYIIIAAASQSQFGQYRITTEFKALPPTAPCPEERGIAPGAQERAELSAQCPVNRFLLSVERPGTLTAGPGGDLRFVLFDSGGSAIAQGARIDQALRAGSYRLAVHSASGASGSFQFPTGWMECAGERPLPLGAPVVAKLTPQCPENPFQVAVARRGRFTVGPVDSLQFVLSEAGGKVIAKGPRIDTELQPGAYGLAVSGAAGAQPFEARLGCLQFDLKNQTAQENREETFASSDFRVGECALKDVPARFTSGYVHQYPLVLTQRSSVLVDLVSSAFEPYVFLLDGAGRRIAEGGGKGRSARIDQRPLAPGKYTIVAVSPSGMAGSYGLRSILKPAPCSVEALGFGKPFERGVVASDCRLCEVSRGSSDCSAGVNEYRLEAGQAGPLRIDLSAAFNADLVVLDGKGTELPAACKSGGGTRNVRIQCSVAAGSYRVLAVALGGGTGSYTVEARRECPPQDLALNANLEETIAGNDCPLADGVFADLYRITTQTPAGFTVEMESSAFAPCVQLLDAAGKRVEPACTTRIARALSPGVYYLIARPLSSGTGPYRLRTSDRTPPCSLKETGVSGTETGRLFIDDCRIKDVLPKETSEAYVDRYSVSVTRRGRLSVAVTTKDFVPCVMLYDSRYNRLGQNCLSGRVTIDPEPVLEPGRYLILVSSLGVSSGDYTLENSFRTP